ncbi:CBL-interacting protein kinase 23 [Gracilariopsis chorda]|uniref:non-specific serine/threonine protein kinase n=1 Tax=Gracilariopsis chorda TaxID=448386 RepID=A0A2V3IJY0_9FLOR|nr:CBL-interacting protein kinase 23 [Gracilariopsis chorda]|eukprot:PXF42382.1 CBL-interacting protein kinase 23 [Gracilariopsis chorda]
MVLHNALSYLTNFMSSPAPPCVGVYHMLETVGKGTFGKVRRARHVFTGQYYAVKIVTTSVLKHDLPANLDIRREMSILRALNHPNIVRLHDVMVSHSRVYLVMDLASGGDFFSVISNKGRLPESLARRYFRQLVNAVHYCHQHQVYHRDLKPENLLLDADGNLKVTDFGFSAMKDHGHLLLRTNCGSPHYCAPEVWNGTQQNGYDGSKSDAFSIGVILFVLLSANQPFCHPIERELLKKVNRCEVKYPDYISPDAVDLLKKLIVRNPSERWSLDMVKRHPWFLAGSLDTMSLTTIPSTEWVPSDSQAPSDELCTKCKVRQCYQNNMLTSNNNNNNANKPAPGLPVV